MFDAAAPRVIHGGDLLAWAERFPAIVAWLRNMTQEVLHWDAWEKNCRTVTRFYVPNPSWEEARGRIVRHVDLSQPCTGNPCLLIGGAAGVGKTRLVFETLRESGVPPGLVVYAADEKAAETAAAFVANTPEQTVIIVADEHSFEIFDADETARHRAQRPHQGHRPFQYDRTRFGGRVARSRVDQGHNSARFLRGISQRSRRIVGGNMRISPRASCASPQICASTTTS